MRQNVLLTPFRLSLAFIFLLKLFRGLIYSVPKSNFFLTIATDNLLISLNLKEKVLIPVVRVCCFHPAMSRSVC